MAGFLARGSSPSTTFPGTTVPSGFYGRRLAAYSCGGSCGIAYPSLLSDTRTAFPWLSPCGEPPFACSHRGPHESRSAHCERRRLLKMRKLSIVGIGAGNPDQITVQAIKTLSSVDVIFLIGKGNDKEDLAQLRKDVCARYITKLYRIVEAQDPARDRTPANYATAVADWHTQRAAIY